VIREEKMKTKNKTLKILVFPVLAIGLLLCGCEENPGSSGSAVDPPAVPAGVSASDGDYRDRVVISWTEPEGAETYKILKSIDTEDEFRVIETGVTGSSYDDRTISISRNYYYKVIAVNGGGESEASESDLGFANPRLPEKITGLTASSNLPLQVAISWDPADDVTHYIIYRSSSSGGEYTEIADNFTGTSYTDGSVSENSSYFYAIAGVNIDGTGELSDPAEGYARCQVPDAPLNLQASDGGYSNKITVSWDAVTSATGYSLYRSDTEDGTYVLIATGIVVLSYEDLVPADTGYFYAVAAVNAGGESELSLPDAGNTDSGAPSIVVAPAGVSATDDEYDRVTVTWGPVDDATGYKVYRSNVADGTYTEIADLTGTTYTDTSMDYMQTLYYKVKAYNTDGESEFSSYDPGYSMRTTPGDPSILTITVNDISIPGTTTITWSAADRADTYILYRSATEDGEYSPVADNITTTTCNDTSAEPAVEFYYKVVAINAGGESNLSAAVMGVAAHPGPDNMAIADMGSGMLSLSWDGVEGASEYEIFRAITSIAVSDPPADEDLYTSIATITHDSTLVSYTYNDDLFWQQGLYIHYRIKVVKEGDTGTLYTGALSNAVTELNGP
jgi:fibronectin type 3 domain-containing protein